MPEKLTGTTADLKKAWSHELKAALRRDVIVPLTGSPAHSPMLMSRYTEILRLAESRFGRRDGSYTVLGIEFIAGDPQIRYFDQGKSIIIQLGKACLREPDRACFQLAHEIVHLLDPTTAAAASVLEEGLATHFQVSYMNHNYPPTGWPRSAISSWGRLPPDEAEYDAARHLVQRLLETDADAIKRFRSNSLKLSQITADQIHGACPTLPTLVARNLASKFEDFRLQTHQPN